VKKNDIFCTPLKLPGNYKNTFYKRIKPHTQTPSKKYQVTTHKHQNKTKTGGGGLL
jgi:hypothetical protein